MITPQLLAEWGACWSPSSIELAFRAAGSTSASPRRVLEAVSVPALHRIWVGCRVLLFRNPGARQVLIRECVRRLGERVGVVPKFFELLDQSVIIPSEVSAARLFWYVSTMDEVLDEAWVVLWDLSVGSGYSVVACCLAAIRSVDGQSAETDWVLKRMLELLGSDAEGWS